MARRRLGERALEQDVADHAPLAGDRLVREEGCARHPRSVAPAVAAPEELVAAADREERCTLVDRIPDRLASHGEVGRDHRLLAILTAADVEQVVRRPRRGSAERDRLDHELMTA